MVPVSFLLSKYEEAVRLAKDQRQAWLEMNKSTSAKLRQKWEVLDTAPKQVNGKWTSVLMLTEPPCKLALRVYLSVLIYAQAMSLSAKLRQLAEQEAQEAESGVTERAVEGAAAWIVDALDIERAQLSI